MTREDSIQIELVRIICITSMMWVHVAPGLSESSYVNGGPGDLLGLFLGQSMGRISVTTLSFVSGYLFWQSGAGKDLPDVCRRLFFAIFMPMLVWSACFILLAKAKAVFLDQPTSALARIEPGFAGMLNAWTGIGGVTANEAMFFIRDLVVSTIIVRLCVPVIRAYPWLAGLAAVGILFVPHLGVVVFRPSILSFVLAGSVAASCRISFEWLSSGRFAIPLGFMMILVALSLTWLELDRGEILGAAHDTSRRVGVGLMVLALTRSVVGSPQMKSLAIYGRHSFLAYLAHMPVIGILWTLWNATVGGPEDSSYLLFFILTPPLCFGLAALLGVCLDRAPPLLQIFLRGRVFSVGANRISPG